MYGEFVLTQENIEIPKAGKIYSFNEGNYQMWDDKLKKYIDDLKDPGPSGKPYSARYIGSLVGDFHRTLLYGGIYGYPRDAKSKNGKLRLLYECAPMSFIVEQAGGKGSDGHHRVLDIQPTEVIQINFVFVLVYRVLIRFGFYSHPTTKFTSEIGFIRLIFVWDT